MLIHFKLNLIWSLFLESGIPGNREPGNQGNRQAVSDMIIRINLAFSSTLYCVPDSIRAIKVNDKNEQEPDLRTFTLKLKQAD